MRLIAAKIFGCHRIVKNILMVFTSSERNKITKKSILVQLNHA